MHELFRTAAWILSFLLGTLWVLIGLVLAAIGWETLRQRLASARWPRVPARIVLSEVEKVVRFNGQTMFRPVVRYTFAVEGVEASSERLAFAGKLYPDESRARKTADRYPVGMATIARCNPDDPAEAVLERRGGVAGFFLLLLGLVLVAVPLAVAHLKGLPSGLLTVGVAAVATLVLLLDRSSRRRLLRARRSGIFPPPGSGSDEDVKRLLRQGEKILAIRLYREIHAVDLKTAKGEVENLAARLRDANSGDIG